MRLTNSDKNAFVKAVMDDVPKVDYSAQAQALVRQWGIEAMPKELQPLVKKHAEYFKDYYVSMPGGVSNFYAKVPPEWEHSGFHNLNPDMWAQVAELGKLAKAQNEARTALQEKVSAMLAGCSTLKSALAKLPEFAKYLPADRGGSGLANLPVANTIADLTAAGWPKGEPRKVEKEN